MYANHVVPEYEPQNRYTFYTPLVTNLVLCLWLLYQFWLICIHIVMWFDGKIENVFVWLTVLQQMASAYTYVNKNQFCHRLPLCMHRNIETHLIANGKWPNSKTKYFKYILNGQIENQMQCDKKTSYSSASLLLQRFTIQLFIFTTHLMRK